MREVWQLPDDEQLRNLGPQWILQALRHNNKEIGAKLLLVLWRTWFVRNELTHSPRQLAIQNSIRFLTDYWETLAGNHQHC